MATTCREVLETDRRNQRQRAQPGHRGQASGEERVNDILIPKNTQLPTAASRVYRTVVENQPRVRVKVLQGEAQQADACISIGECWIEGLPPNLPKSSPVQVRCGVGSNGLIDVHGPGHDQRQNGPHRNPPQQRPVRRRNRPRSRLGAKLEDSMSACGSLSMVHYQ